MECQLKPSTLLNSIVCILLLVPFTSATCVDKFDSNTICTLVMNGTKIKDPRACNTWIECIDGQPTTGTCESDYYYDRVTMECVPAENIECISSNPCSTVIITDSPIFVPDPCACNAYYYCTNSTSAHGFCTSGWNFNPGTGNCIRNFPCVSMMDPNSYCNIVPDGVYIKDTASCNGWQMCWDGTVINGTCPGTFYFDPLTGFCDYPQNVDCVNVVTEPPDAPNPTEVCHQAGQFVSDEHTCNGYYLCHTSDNSAGIELVHGTCPSGWFFDAADTGSCVPRTQIVCPYDRCAGLGDSGIQLANLSDDNCQGYAICQDGSLIGSGECPEDEYFNEIKQRCTTQIVNYPACVMTSGTTSAFSPKVTSTIETTETTATSMLSPSSNEKSDEEED